MRFLALLAALLLVVLPGCTLAEASSFYGDGAYPTPFYQDDFYGTNPAPGGNSLLTAYETSVTSTESLTNDSVLGTQFSNGGSAFTVDVDERSWWNETTDQFEPDIEGVYILQCTLSSVGSVGRFTTLYVVNGSVPSYMVRWNDNDDNRQVQSHEYVYLNGTTDDIACAWGSTGSRSASARSSLIGPIATSPSRARVVASDTSANNSMNGTKYTGGVSGPTVQTDADSLWDATDKRFEPTSAGWYALDCNTLSNASGRFSTTFTGSTTYETADFRYADNQDHWVSGSAQWLYHDGSSNWSACSWAAVTAGTQMDGVFEIYGPIGNDSETKHAKLDSTESMSNNSMGSTKFSGAVAALTVVSDTEGYWDATDKRFEPSTAGWYIIDCTLSGAASGRFTPSVVGTTSDSSELTNGADNDDAWVGRMTVAVEMNGTTDHVACAWSSTISANATAESVLIGPIAL